MSILIYTVSADWVPPVDEGWELPMLRSSMSQYAVDLRSFEHCVAERGEAEAIEYMGKPDQRQYWPAWTREERTHYIAYCTTTGTSISSVCATMEALAQSLADNKITVERDKVPTVIAWIEALRESPCFKPKVEGAAPPLPRFLANPSSY